MERDMVTILREILAEDRTILTRREDILAELKKKEIPPSLMREYNTIVSALRNADVGDVFAHGEFDREGARAEIVRRMQEIGKPDSSISFVLQTFEQALEWDKAPVGLVPDMPKNPAAEKTVSLEKNIDPTYNIPATEEVHEINEVNPPAKFVEDERPDVPPVPSEKIFDRTDSVDTGGNSDNRDSGGGANKSRSNFLIPLVIIAAVAAAIVCYMFFNRAPEPEPPVANNNYLNAKTELSLDGVDLGVSVNRLKELLGVEAFAENRGDYDFYKFGELDVEVREDKVSALSTGSPEFKTSRGLHVGSTYAEVTEAYGTDSNDRSTATANVYEYPFASLSNEAGILKFVVDKTDSRVTYISARILPQKKEPIDENTKYAARGLFDFHEAVDAKNYDKAYNLMTSNYRALAGTSQQFAEACKNIVSSRIVDLKKVESGENYVILDYVLDMRKNYEGGKFLYQRFQGRVKMIREVGVWMVDKVDYKKIDELIEK